MPMTIPTLDELRKRSEAATPGMAYARLNGDDIAYGELDFSGLDNGSKRPADREWVKAAKVVIRHDRKISSEGIANLHFLAAAWNYARAILASPDPIAAAYLAGQQGMRERAARACVEMAAEFLSPEYAVGQPASSTSERFACDQCAAAIRALPDAPSDGGRD